MKKLFFLTVFILIAGFSFAQEIQKKILYSGGVYGQTFELIELSDDEGCVLCLYMTDNKDTNKNRVTFIAFGVVFLYNRIMMKNMTTGLKNAAGKGRARA